MKLTSSKILKNLSLMIISVIVTLSILEVIMRIFYYIPSPTMDEFDLKTSNYYQKDDVLWWVPRNNIHGVHNKHGSFETTFNTNSSGIRDKEYSLNKPKGIQRIVVIGDSYTWGFGVNDSEIYTERLEAILPNTEVINLGVTAYSLWQEILYLKREGLKYDPDIVILGLCMNDIVWGMDHPKISDGEKKNALKKSDQVNIKEYLKKYILHKSSLYQFIIDRVYTSKRLVKAMIYLGLRGPLIGFVDLDVALMPALRNYSDVVDKMWTVTESELINLKRLTSDKGIRLIVAVNPSPLAIDETRFKQTISQSIFDAKDFDLDKPYRLLERFAAKNNIEIIIPLNVFRQAHKQGKPLYLERDTHFNPEGHNLFGHKIAEYMLNELKK